MFGRWLHLATFLRGEGGRVSEGMVLEPLASYRETGRWRWSILDATDRLERVSLRRTCDLNGNDLPLRRVSNQITLKKMDQSK